jgi:thiamine biosynthesis lipoprotein
MRFSYQLLAIVLGLQLSTGCSTAEKEAITLQGRAFGTTYHVQYYGDKSLPIAAGLDSVIEQVNASVSTYQDDSLISRINQGDSTVIVDPIFRKVFALSAEVNKRSRGYFDPTIGVLRNAYGFGEDQPLKQIDQVTIDSLIQYVGFQKVNLLPDGRVRKAHPNIYLDFNAVAKGYGVDLIGEYLVSQGIENFLVELGGEIVTKGTNLQKEKPWVVGIEQVNSELGQRSIEASLSLTDRAMASSGNYRKFRVDPETGVRYVHTIDPLTGSAEQSDVTSATVIAEDCATADAYATAFMAMGLERSKRLLERLQGLEVYLTYEQGGTTQVFATPGMEALLRD